MVTGVSEDMENIISSQRAFKKALEKSDCNGVVIESNGRTATVKPLKKKDLEKGLK